MVTPYWLHYEGYTIRRQATIGVSQFCFWSPLLKATKIIFTKIGSHKQTFDKNSDLSSWPRHLTKHAVQQLWSTNNTMVDTMVGSSVTVVGATLEQPPSAGHKYFAPKLLLCPSSSNRQMSHTKMRIRLLPSTLKAERRAGGGGEIQGQPFSGRPTSAKNSTRMHHTKGFVSNTLHSAQC